MFLIKRFVQTVSFNLLVLLNPINLQFKSSTLIQPYHLKTYYTIFSIHFSFFNTHTNWNSITIIIIIISKLSLGLNSRQTVFCAVQIPNCTNGTSLHWHINLGNVHSFFFVFKYDFIRKFKYFRINPHFSNSINWCQKNKQQFNNIAKKHCIICKLERIN